MPWSSIKNIHPSSPLLRKLVDIRGLGLPAALHSLARDGPADSPWRNLAHRETSNARDWFGFHAGL